MILPLAIAFFSFMKLPFYCFLAYQEIRPTTGYCLSCPTRNYHWLLFVLPYTKLPLVIVCHVMPYTKLPLVIVCLALHEITIGYCLSCHALHEITIGYCLSCPPLVIVCLALHEITIGYYLSCPTQNCHWLRFSCTHDSVVSLNNSRMLP